MTIPTIKFLLSDYTKRLSEAAVDSPKLCSEMILSEVMGLSRAQILGFGEREVTLNLLELCEEMIKKRETGEPMAYILSRKEFYGREFIVSSDVLIPRPETELLIELALKELSIQKKIRFADLGCGSGCILSTLLLEAANWGGIGVDISEEAIEVTHKNLIRYKVDRRARLMRTDFRNNPFGTESFELIVSNPPYIPTAEYEELGFEVKDFEPRLALDSGPDGLKHPRQVVQIATQSLISNGLLLMEIGSAQGSSALTIFDSKLWGEVKIIPDLAGRDRVVYARKS